MVNQIKFGISTAITSTIFVLLFEIFLLIKFVPYYNNLMNSLYQAGGITSLTIVKTFFISAILSLIIGFLFGFMLAWIYNKLLVVKVK